MVRALITGITGQDGSYLAELLVEQGHEVHGVNRPGSDQESSEISGVIMHGLDFGREPDFAPLLAEVQPQRIYNLAAVSSVARSWVEPDLTAQVNGLAVSRLIAAVSEFSISSSEDVRFVQASSAEIFGSVPGIVDSDILSDEHSPIRPSSPYGAAKAYAHSIVGVYRGAGLHASSCILFNHESPRRPATFVTRKITRAVARIALGLEDKLELGNTQAQRDWGWAPDYVDAMVRAGEAAEPSDYVVATGIAHSVEDFARIAFACAGIADWRSHVEVSGALHRPSDVRTQRGDATKARTMLDWKPTRSFEEIVRAMVDADLAELRAQ